MNTILLISAVILLVGYVIYRTLFSSVSERVIRKQTIYKYKAKECLMTQSEIEFFKILTSITKDRYYVFPQVHLSAILEHKIAGQNWRNSFSHINGKSVDYVLCDMASLKPIYAIELDDKSHEAQSRMKRDREVERIFASTSIPLVRFKDYKSLTSEDIIECLRNARSSTIST